MVFLEKLDFLDKERQANLNFDEIIILRLRVPVEVFCFCIYLPGNLLNNPISHQMEHIFPSKK